MFTFKFQRYHLDDHVSLDVHQFTILLSRRVTSLNGSSILRPQRSLADVCRVSRIVRNIACSNLENSEDGDHRVDTLIKADRHELLTVLGWSWAARNVVQPGLTEAAVRPSVQQQTQPLSRRVRTSVKITVDDKVAALTLDRYLLRRSRSLLGNELVCGGHSTIIGCQSLQFVLALCNWDSKHVSKS
ncbi:hypothetical protein PHSY_001594 [Pseudozyma hubeiensis SY62]|uniref:Uncharacterized protein n=1 Tax=Pseudozyma hubeiensis (strain SY62) TaxID=1305764 RepID=R9P7E7_PSEHS|nr:hypothetical protein PHSY_001594 [Pseudozyma hubeiensis SY62]GAC94025.1 hypothetical protein PHSY_001594 [Pseudozyma hubeiensis SY62]